MAEESTNTLIAYKDITGSFAGIEVLSGNPKQIEDLKKILTQSWHGMSTEGVKIVYEGTSIADAKKAIGTVPIETDDITSF